MAEQLKPFGLRPRNERPKRALPELRDVLRWIYPEDVADEIFERLTDDARKVEGDGQS